MDNWILDCKRLAIMGGTFDPVHFGHLATAEAVRSQFNIDKVLFIPTGMPPHKKNSKVTSSEHRYLMTVLATVDNPHFFTSRIEIDRPGETYTIDTITQLRTACSKDAEIYFITGADAVFDILTWREAERLLTICNFIAVSRPGYKNDKLIKDIEEINAKYNSNVRYMEVPALAISSSDIRKRVSENQPVKYLLPANVENYLYKHGLYNKEIEVDEAEINEKLKGWISHNRINHTVGVCGQAIVYAKQHGCDIRKAYTAAIYHDIAKEITRDEKKRLCLKFKINLDDYESSSYDVSHSFLGAEIAKNEFNIYDEDILNAIRYHTTGRRKMSLLEKIIFLADATEPGRDKYGSEAKELEAICLKDMDKAMVVSLENKFKYCKSKKQDVHPFAEKALKYYKKQVTKMED